jgi:hypothetical protein
MEVRLEEAYLGRIASASEFIMKWENVECRTKSVVITTLEGKQWGSG